MVTETEENFLKHYRNKRTFLWIIYAGIILISGIAIGVGGTILLVKYNIIWIDHKFKNTAAITEEISTKYGLDQQQTKQVEGVLNRAFEQRQLRREETNKERYEEAQILIAEMNDVLNPQQFERWNKDFQTMREKFKNRFKQSGKK